MARSDPFPPSGDGGSFNFCDSRTRRNFYDTIAQDYQDLINELRTAGLQNLVGNIRIDFHFETDEGIASVSRFRSIEKLENFLFFTPGYQAQVRKHGTADYQGTVRYSMEKPDWSRAGLCQYTKTINLGVTRTIGPKQYEFKNYRTYYGE